MSKYQKGETIIELVIAFAIFSLAAVGTIAILNKGIAATQRNLEATLVRQQVDSQADLLRYLHDTHSPVWTALIAPANTTPTPAPITDDSTSCPTTGSSTLAKGFYIKPTINADPTLTSFAIQYLSAATYSQPQTYAKIDYASGAAKSEGLWIQVSEAENDSGSPVRAYDFYIHTCWPSVGLDTPMTLGTIVRLYEK